MEPFGNLGTIRENVSISPFVNRPILENFFMQKEKKKKKQLTF